jgi:short-subunit dehydrogenase
MPDPTWKRALVTGASSGIGEEFARQLAAAGTDLVIVARSTDKLEALAAEVRADHDVEVDTLSADLTDPADLERVEERVRDVAVPIDLLVNNAGVGSTGRFVEQDHQRVDDQVKLNVTAVTRLTHAALPGMLGRGRGGILNVSSIASFQPIPRFSVYAASKAYVRSFSEAIHEELLGTGVHVTALCPGFTRTNFPEAAGAEDDATKIPDFIWMEADPVVASGLKAIASNRAVVVPGLQYKVSSSASQVLPSGVTRRLISLASRVAGID